MHVPHTQSAVRIVSTFHKTSCNTILRHCDSDSNFTHQCCPSVHSSVCLSPKCVHDTIFPKTKQLTSYGLYWRPI